jgi:RNase P subunit RPR2
MPEARGLIRKISAERIEILYAAAVKAYPKETGLARGYIKLLLEIGRHYKVRIPAEMGAHICKECYLPLIEGLNCEQRVIAKEKRIIYRCKNCRSVNSLAFKVAAVS